MTLVLTLRADFYNEALLHRGLADALPKGQVNLGSMLREELIRAVTEPAEKVCLNFESGLVGRLLDDVGEEAGNLPLMEFALKALWEGRRGSRLLHEVYVEMGGIKGAIAERAERFFAQLIPNQQKVAEQVFTALVRAGEETGDTRRRATRAEFDTAGQGLIDTLAGKNARLLVTGRDSVTDQETVEVAHEALLREWSRLRQWIEDRRGALRLRDKVCDEACQWAAEGRPDVRRWKHELLKPARRQLETAELLQGLERNPINADFLTPEADWLLAELLCSRTDHARREAIGLQLAEIEPTDPRPGVGVTDGVADILWCEIPAAQGAAVEIEGHGRFAVLPFHVAAYPVTYAQYRAFLDAEDSYRADAWWHDLHKEPEPGELRRRYVNYPADNVSWYDAMAFCHWLSARLGFEVRLPDEWEWQWAAQGAGAGLAYPWGDKWQEGMANTDESGIGRTTAVGMYPGGRSRQGVYDLAGNVWEWCRNRYQYPKELSTGGGESRVLRGGSWGDYRGGARAAATTTLVFVWCVRPPSAEHCITGHWTLIRGSLDRAQRSRAHIFHTLVSVPRRCRPLVPRRSASVPPGAGPRSRHSARG